jgi:rhomboid protease GluP
MAQASSSMRGLPQKIRQVFLPYLLIWVGCLAGYSLLNWLLFIRFQLIPLEPDITNFWLPFGLPWIPTSLWLRPRLDGLNLASENSRWRDFYFLAAALSIAIPLSLTQVYLATAAAGRTDLGSIHEFDDAPRTKYYTVRDVAFDKANATYALGSHLLGKQGETTVMEVFFVCPVVDAREPLGAYATLWLGTHFSENTSSALSSSVKDREFKDFVAASLENFSKMDLPKPSFFERLGPGALTKGFKSAALQNALHATKTPIEILVAHNERFEDRSGNMQKAALGSMAAGLGVWFLLVVAAPVSRSSSRHRATGETGPSRELSFFSKFLLPGRNIPMTGLLIDVNLVVFVIMVLMGMGVVSVSASDLVAAGGNFGPLTLHGQSWRLLTSMFIHGGLLHLAGNLGSLFFIGMFLEAAIGRACFLACYLAGGLGASIASAKWHESTVSVGASGAIFALVGVLLVLTLLNKRDLPLEKGWVLRFVLSWLALQLIIGFASNLTDVAAHIGGLVTGLLLGLFFVLYPDLLPRARK